MHCLKRCGKYVVSTGQQFITATQGEYTYACALMTSIQTHLQWLCAGYKWHWRYLSPMTTYPLHKTVWALKPWLFQGIVTSAMDDTSTSKILMWFVYGISLVLVFSMAYNTSLITFLCTSPDSI